MANKINLEKSSGLRIFYENGRLHFNKSILHKPPAFRTLKAARTFLKNKKSSFSRPNLYLMYRGVAIKEDARIFKKYRLRYDITVIYCGFLDNEFNRTIGHRHRGPYPEIYEVLSGKGLFLLQKTKGTVANKTYLVKISRGDKIVVPPNFGHVTINISNEPLIIANIFSNFAKSDYSLYKKMHGPGYYVLNSGIVKNSNFKKVAPLKLTKPKNNLFLGTASNKSLYKTFIENPEKFVWLNNPNKFKKQLSEKNNL